MGQDSALLYSQKPASLCRWNGPHNRGCCNAESTQVNLNLIPSPPQGNSFIPLRVSWWSSDVQYRVFENNGIASLGFAFLWDNEKCQLAAFRGEKSLLSSTENSPWSRAAKNECSSPATFIISVDICRLLQKKSHRLLLTDQMQLGMCSFDILLNEALILPDFFPLKCLNSKGCMAGLSWEERLSRMQL